MSAHFDSMTFLLTHPYYLIPLCVFVLICSNWWWAAFVYFDAKERGIRHKLFWALIALCTIGPAIVIVYKAWTKRPQTLLSATPLGVIAGEKLEKTGTRGKTILIFLCLAWVGLAVFYVLRKGGNVDMINFSIYGIIAPLILAAYIFFALKHPDTINPMDKPLWGMKVTPDGRTIDESLTKHKKAAVW